LISQKLFGIDFFSEGEIDFGWEIYWDFNVDNKFFSPKVILMHFPEKNKKKAELVFLRIQRFIH